jgi:hypothetical protein
MTINSINEISDGLTVDNLLIQNNAISSTAGNLVIKTDGTNPIQIKDGATLLYEMSNAGDQSIPLQPCFVAKRTDLLIDVTGDGTVYTPSLDVDLFNVGTNYVDPTFTAPVTGIYFLCASCTYLNVSSAMTTGYVKIVTTSRTFLKYWNPFNNFSGTLSSTCRLSVITQMTAGDTAFIESSISGGTKTADLRNFAINTASYFNGVLLG